MPKTILHYIDKYSYYFVQPLYMHLVLYVRGYIVFISPYSVCVYVLITRLYLKETEFEVLVGGSYFYVAMLLWK